MRRLLLLVPLILATPLARAEVVAASAAGFEVRDSAVVKAPSDRVYAGLLQIGRWWNPQHTWSGNAAHLSLDAKPGGCFCETLPDGGGVRHMTVSFVMPGKLLRLDGALGPLQGEGLAGSMTWSLAPADGGTTLTLDYKVGGYAARPLPEWAGAVDGVLAEQFQRLRRWIETGKPE